MADMSLEDVLKQVDDLERGWNQDTDPATGLLTPPKPAADAAPSNPLRLRDAAPELPPADASPVQKLEPTVATQPMEPNAVKLPAPMEPSAMNPPPPAGATVPPGQPDWAQLQKDLQAAQGRAENTRTIGAMLEAAAPRFHAPANAGSEDIAAAETPLKIAQEQQAYELRQEQLKGMQEKPATSDPNSAVSQRARDAIKTFFKGTELPASIDSMSADEVGKFIKDPLLDLKKLDQAKATSDAMNNYRNAQLGDLSGYRKGLITDTQDAAKARADQIAAAQKLADEKLAEEVRHNQATEATAAKKKASGLPAGPLTEGDASSITNPADRAIVSSIIHGETGISSVSKKDATRIMGEVLQINPKYDPTKVEAYKALRTKLSEDPRVTAMNTTFHHLDLAEQNMPNNFDSQLANRVWNNILDATGSSKLTPFETEVAGAGHEYAKSLGIDDMDGRHQIVGMLSTAQSPQQLQQRLNAVRLMIGGRADAEADRFKSVAPEGATIQILSPANDAKLRALQGNAVKPAPAGSPAPPVKMKFPDGSIQPVDADKVEKARGKGGVVVSG